MWLKGKPVGLSFDYIFFSIFVRWIPVENTKGRTREERRCVCFRINLFTLKHSGDLLPNS